jgi:hypothetical protein
MRSLITCYAVLLTTLCQGQSIPTQDPNQQMREDVARWVETMSRIQKEESEWSRDSEVLANYKEGLSNEISSLHQAIVDAKPRKEAAELHAKETILQHEQYVHTKKGISKQLYEAEQKLMQCILRFPQSLSKQPKVAQAILDLKTSSTRSEEEREMNLSKRMYNLVELLTEVEKFQQEIHLTSELHKDAQGREFQLQVVYFGLAMAYGVNADQSFAVVGAPNDMGWQFTERIELASKIQELVDSVNEPKNARFISLPLIKP